ncbi:glycogen/starch/alpha-glucan phosphorylase [Candidatus Saccharibacteria bacterium]|nr:glycogen/starch/alpha-glucan phosphorylase [Candidatus Saccharibacteria bacterium]
MKNEVPKMYTYWSLEYYDQENGIRGGGGLGVLAADTRRIAESLDVPFVIVTPFYPKVCHQKMVNGKLVDETTPVDYHDYGYKLLDTVYIKCNGEVCKLDVVGKKLGASIILAVTEPNFGVLYQGLSGSDHRLYQEVALGFGGYKALKLTGIRPNAMQLNEVPTFFAALARLDDLVSSGVNLYEAIVYVRMHALYTNHTLVQAAEAEFSFEQFERYVFPNLKARAVKRWLKSQFEDGKLKLSSVIIELTGQHNGVSKLHARLANYHDIAGDRVNFKPITNGVDMKKWVLPSLIEYYCGLGLMDDKLRLTDDYAEKLKQITADEIRNFKAEGRRILNETLAMRPDQNGESPYFGDDEMIFVFKRRFVDYKRPEMPFTDIKRLREILEPYNAHYILSGRVHNGDTAMSAKLQEILEKVKNDDYLKSHVHYIADYDEEVAYALSVGSNFALNLPVVGLEACGTSWMKDVANMNFLISTPDGGVADVESKYYMPVTGENFDEELDSLYTWMKHALSMWESDYDLADIIQSQLTGFLPTISGTRMFREYCELILPQN